MTGSRIPSSRMARRGSCLYRMSCRLNPRTRRAAGQARLLEIRSRSASELFDLAKRAAGSDSPRLRTGERSASVRSSSGSPIIAQARRLLGYVPYQGGWARPYAIQQFQNGYVNHPTFGWVKADWLSHLERGELPSPPSRGKVSWLPATDVDRLRADWNPPLADLHRTLRDPDQRSARRCHRVWPPAGSLPRPVHVPPGRRPGREPAAGPPIPRAGADVGEPVSKRHVVYYFASKQQFVDYLTPKYGDDIKESLGFFDPPKAARGGRAPAYFYYYANGQLPVEANLYHEVSHQLLFEMAGHNAYTANFGNYWVFEGLGTYFETIEPQPDGSLEVGGLVGRRVEEAIKSLVDQEQVIPLAEFVALGEKPFMNPDRRRFLRYQQAEALTVFLMQWHEGTYREGFFDYIRDAYRGRIKRGSGRTLVDRLGQPYSTLEAQFLAFLKDGQARRHDAGAGQVGFTRLHPDRASPRAGQARLGGIDPDCPEIPVSGRRRLLTDIGEQCHEPRRLTAALEARWNAAQLPLRLRENILFWLVHSFLRRPTSL